MWTTTKHELHSLFYLNHMIIDLLYNLIKYGEQMGVFRKKYCKMHPEEGTMNDKHFKTLSLEE